MKRFESFIEKAEAINTEDALLKLFEDTTKEFGIDYLCYFVINPGDVENSPYHHVHGTFPDVLTAGRRRGGSQEEQCSKPHGTCRQQANLLILCPSKWSPQLSPWMSSREYVAARAAGVTLVPSTAGWRKR